MSEEDELVLGTIAGVDLILSPEHYSEYKGTLNKQIEELKNQLQQKENIIKEVREKLGRDYYIGYMEHNDNVIDEILEILDKGGNE